MLANPYFIEMLLLFLILPEFMNFINSQEVKQQIISHRHTMDKLESGLWNGKLINGASQTQIYEIGKLPSGIYVALRWIGVYSSNLELMNHMQKSRLESYALNAENLSSQGIDVVSFCVGVYLKGEVGLLLEDLTAGGKNKVTALDDVVCSVVSQEGMERLVHVDIDDRWNDSAEGKKFRYFDESAMIVFP